jgi:hypothetical protein
MSEVLVCANEIVPNYQHVKLCDDAEPRMKKAFADKALLVVNRLMLVKYVGRPVGIPLQEADLDGGAMQLNNWYDFRPAGEIYDSRQEEILDRAFLGGEVSVDLPGITSWYRLRDVDAEKVSPKEDLTVKARRIAASLKKGGPKINGMLRHAYWVDGYMH